MAYIYVKYLDIFSEIGVMPRNLQFAVSQASVIFPEKISR